jgi:hypothetical protein
MSSTEKQPKKTKLGWRKPIPTQKVCKGPCGQLLPISEFPKRSDGPHRGECGECHHLKKYGVARKFTRETIIASNTGHKVCSNCSQEKPEDEMFDFDNKIGSDCLECVATIYNSAQNLNKLYCESPESPEEVEEGYQRCVKCDKIKNIVDNFQFRTDSLKYRTDCIECRNAYNRKYYKDIASGSRSLLAKPVIVDGKKQCQYCKIWKELEDMLKNGQYQDGHTNECKKCNNLRLRVYRLIRTIKDPAFKLMQLIRGYTRYGLKFRKVDKTIEYVGCNGQTLKEWLEYNMEEGMTWDNHGTLWQIDHVIPITKFDMSDAEQVKRCFSWCNMRPLEAVANNTKNNNVLSEQVHTHLKAMEEYQEKFEQNTMEYQALSESLEWLRKMNSGMVKISSDKVE